MLLQQKWSQLTKIAPLKNLLAYMEVLILVTNDQNCWKTESGKHFGLTTLWGSVKGGACLGEAERDFWCLQTVGREEGSTNAFNEVLGHTMLKQQDSGSSTVETSMVEKIN